MTPPTYNPANLVTVRQLAARYPVFTKQYVQYLLRFNKGNFADCALKIGGKVFVDLCALEAWIAVNAVRPTGNKTKKQP